jgi:tetratricopeptide (TPR) repeat protein
MDLCRKVVARCSFEGDPAGEIGPTRALAHLACAEATLAVQMLEDAAREVELARSAAGADADLLRRVAAVALELAVAQGDFKRALVLVREAGDPRQEVASASQRHAVAVAAASALASLGDRVAALDMVTVAESLLPEDKMAAVECLKARAMVDAFTGDLRSAALHCEMASDVAREAGLSYEVTLNLVRLGEVLAECGELARAYGAVRQAIEIAEDTGFERLANGARMLLALLDGLQGMPDAEKLLAQGVAFAEGRFFLSDALSGRMWLARLLRERGRLGQAAAEYDKALSLAARTGRSSVARECEKALRGLGGTTPTATT